MSVEINEILKIIDTIAPEHLMEGWDNSGIQINSGKPTVNRVMVCLEINQDVVDEAIDLHADLIISHHPLIFKNMKRVDYGNDVGRLMIRLIKNDISVYSSHTSFDSAIGGNNDYLAKLLGLKNIEVLSKIEESFYKLVVFVPEDSLGAIRQVICDSGAGKLGNYSDCSFSLLGTGTFTPDTNANPTIGKRNQFEQVREYRLESIVSGRDLDKVIANMLKVHPYEMPAYDVFKLENDLSTVGLGRIGYLDTDYSFAEVLALVKKALHIKKNINWVGDEDKTIRKVALCTGSGSDLMSLASQKKCDLFITGDVKYHDAHLANQLGIGVIDAGHFYTEAIFSENMSGQLQKHLSDKVEIFQSKVNLNPFNID